MMLWDKECGSSSNIMVLLEQHNKGMQECDRLRFVDFDGRFQSICLVWCSCHALLGKIFDVGELLRYYFNL